MKTNLTSLFFLIKNNCINSSSERLLAIAVTLLLTGLISAGEDDSKTEKAIQALGGRVIRRSNVPGKQIIVVILTSTKLTDAALKELELARFKGLVGLGLRGTQVTDEGMKHLGLLKNLRILSLGNTKVTDVGLNELAGLKSLGTLELDQTEVTNAGMKVVAGFKSLVWLELEYTKVTDVGLKDLAGLNGLERLDVGANKVTDASVKELAGHKSLKTLLLYGTQLSDAGVVELRQALPKCEIRTGK